MFRSIKAKDSKSLSAIDPIKADVFVLGLVFMKTDNMNDVTNIYSQGNNEIDRSVYIDI